MCVFVWSAGLDTENTFNVSPLLPVPFVTTTQRHEPHNPATVFSCCVAVGRG
jgi:hypothetical protein